MLTARSSHYSQSVSRCWCWLESETKISIRLVKDCLGFLHRTWTNSSDAILTSYPEVPIVRVARASRFLCLDLSMNWSLHAWGFHGFDGCFNAFFGPKRAATETAMENAIIQNVVEFSNCVTRRSNLYFNSPFTFSPFSISLRSEIACHILPRKPF